MTDHDGLSLSAEAPVDEEDRATLAEVRRLYEQLDPVPVGLVERVRFALLLEQMDTEVAKLVEESVPLAGVRGAVAETTEQARTVIFESSALTVMVTVSPTGQDRLRVDGWLSPADGYRVEVRSTDLQLRTDSDADGRFVVPDLPRGLFRMVIWPPTGTGRPDNPPVVITPSVVFD